MANLTNEDFRRMLNEPAPGSGGNETSSSVSKKKKEKGKKKTGQEKDVEDEEVDETRAVMSRYRDRAAERRQVGADGAGGEDFLSPSFAEEKEDVSVETTFIVKGLDMALLEKTKAEQEEKNRLKKKVAEAEEEKQQQQEKLATSISATTTTTSSSMASRLSQLLENESSLSSLSSSSSSSSSKVSHLFSPGLMGYVFDLVLQQKRDTTHVATSPSPSSGGGGVFFSDLPTTNIRSRAAPSSSSSSRVRRSPCHVDATLLDELRKIRVYGPGWKKEGNFAKSLVGPSKDGGGDDDEGQVRQPEDKKQKIVEQEEEEENIFSDISDDDDGAGDDVVGVSQAPQAALGGAKSFLKTSASLSLVSGAAVNDMLKKGLGTSRFEDAVSKAAQEERRKEELKKKREREEDERSRSAADRASGGQGAYASYFKRRESDLKSGSVVEIFGSRLGEEEEEQQEGHVVIEADEGSSDGGDGIEEDLLQQFRSRLVGLHEQGEDGTKKKKKKEEQPQQRGNGKKKGRAEKRKVDAELQEIDRVLEQKGTSIRVASDILQKKKQKKKSPTRRRIT